MHYLSCDCASLAHCACTNILYKACDIIKDISSLPLIAMHVISQHDRSDDYSKTVLQIPKADTGVGQLWLSCVNTAHIDFLPCVDTVNTATAPGHSIELQLIKLGLAFYASSTKDVTYKFHLMLRRTRFGYYKKFSVQIFC